VVVSAMVGFVVGCLLGLPAIRIKGQYLAMVTLSFAVAFPMVVQRFSWFTGGSSGPPTGSGVRAPSWFPAGKDQAWLHLLVSAVAVLVLILLRNLLGGSVGRAIRASAQGELAAGAMGVNVVRTRTVVFGLAAAMGAIGGALLSVNDRVVTTEQFDLFRSLALYTAIVFGGAELLSGAVVGAILIVAVPYVNTRQGWKISPNLIFGLLVLAGAAAVPDGVTPTLARWRRRVVRVVDSDERSTFEGGAGGEAVPATSSPAATDGRGDGVSGSGSGEPDRSGDGDGRAAVSARPGPVEAPRGPGSSTPSPRGSA
jgi:branched-chain amino acid transport system permease protein